MSYPIGAVNLYLGFNSPSLLEKFSKIRNILIVRFLSYVRLLVSIGQTYGRVCHDKSKYHYNGLYKNAHSVAPVVMIFQGP